MNLRHIIAGAVIFTTAALVPSAGAAPYTLRITGTTDEFGGLPGGLEVVQTVVFDTDTVPTIDAAGNVTTATYEVDSFELKIGGTVIVPTNVPAITIRDATPGGLFGDPDQFRIAVALEESIGAAEVTSFSFYPFDYDQVAISDTSLPTSAEYFQQFEFSTPTQFNYTSGGNNYAGGLLGTVVTITPVPEPASAAVVGLAGLAALRRRPD